MQQQQQQLDPSTKVPWKEIFTSKPMLALSVAHMCNNWGFYTLLTCLPTFLKDILQFDIAHVSSRTLSYLFCYNCHQLIDSQPVNRACVHFCSNLLVSSIVCRIFLNRRDRVCLLRTESLCQSIIS